MRHAFTLEARAPTARSGRPAVDLARPAACPRAPDHAATEHDADARPRGSSPRADRGGARPSDEPTRSETDHHGPAIRSAHTDTPDHARARADRARSEIDPSRGAYSRS